MMGSSAKRQGRQESLFEIEESDTPKKVPHPLPSEPSSEFAAMVDEVGGRLERRKKRSKTIAASRFDRAKAETQEMIKSGDWSECAARHLVALYDLMHEKCYGFVPDELGPKERYHAACWAANLVKSRFDGDFQEVVEYMRWVWTREIAREKKRRAQGTDGSRISIRNMFLPSFLLSDYRLSLARSSHRT